MAQPKVFISYRRADTSAEAGRLYDALSRRFGRAGVFMDVDTVRPGDDWVEAINHAIAESDVVLVLIGRDWLGATSTDSGRRLDDPLDRVRLEIESALAADKTVIPVLIEATEMPGDEQLPASLRRLARHQALRISHQSFASDLATLVRALRRLTGGSGTKPTRAKREPDDEQGARGAAPAAGVAVTRGFLFADLREYSSFVERHGDDAAAALLERYRWLVRAVVGRHAGAEVRTEGDSFYVLFPSASAAVSAGLAIVAEAASHNVQQPDAPILVGVGIHAGETAETAEGPVGSAVNIAARICAQAASGEVLVSDTVRSLTRTRQVAAFELAGTRSLKGIAEPVSLYRAQPPDASAQSAVTAIPARRPSLAALAGRVGSVRERPTRFVALLAGLTALALVGGWGIAALLGAAFGGGRSSGRPPVISGGSGLVTFDVGASACSASRDCYIYLLDAATDPDGDPLTIVSVEPSRSGASVSVATLGGRPVARWTAPRDFSSVSDSFDFSIADDNHNVVRGTCEVVNIARPVGP